MDYQKHYNLLVERGRSNRPLETYSEKHHILPRCMGGLDTADNFTQLTAEEHFMAHKLLVMIYPESKALVYAATQMACVGKGQQRANNKVYGWLRRKKSKIMSEKNIGNNHAKGNKLSSKTRDRMAIAKTGHKHSEETKQKIRATNILTKSSSPKKTVSSETRAKISAGLVGKHPRAMAGKKHSAETRAKMTASQFARAALIKEAKACQA